MDKKTRCFESGVSKNSQAPGKDLGGRSSNQPHSRPRSLNAHSRQFEGKFLSGVAKRRGLLKSASLNKVKIKRSDFSTEEKGKRTLEQVSESVLQLKPIQRLLEVCTADVPTKRPQQCALCVRFHRPEFPCLYL